jgi:hypothetical protein
VFLLAAIWILQISSAKIITSSICTFSWFYFVKTLSGVFHFAAPSCSFCVCVCSSAVDSNFASSPDAAILFHFASQRVPFQSRASHAHVKWPPSFKHHIFETISAPTASACRRSPTCCRFRSCASWFHLICLLRKRVRMEVTEVQIGGHGWKRIDNFEC